MGDTTQLSRKQQQQLLRLFDQSQNQGGGQQQSAPVIGQGRGGGVRPRIKPIVEPIGQLQRRFDEAKTGLESEIPLSEKKKLFFDVWTLFLEFIHIWSPGFAKSSLDRESYQKYLLLLADIFVTCISLFVTPIQTPYTQATVLNLFSRKTKKFFLRRTSACQI